MPVVLTPKQEAFAQAYVETGNASEAYRRAGYSTRQSAKAINENASKLLAKILPRVRELQAAARKRHEINVETITEMLKEDRELARNLEMPAAAVSAAMGLAKLHGLIVEKRQNTNVNYDVTQLSDTELEDIAAGRSEAPAASPPGSSLTH